MVNGTAPNRKDTLMPSPHSTAVPTSDDAAGPSRPCSKEALLIALLRRDIGATLDELAAATGWQPHSVRGAIAGRLKRRLGLDIRSEITEAERRYRIVEAG